MLGHISWSRWVLLLVSVLSIAVSSVTIDGKSQGGGIAFPVLTGKWKLETGNMVEMVNIRHEGRWVFAQFSAPKKCWNLPYVDVFSGELDTTNVDPPTFTIRPGSFQACTRTRKMWEECKTVKKLFVTEFRKVTVLPNSIKGEVLRPGYWLPDGDFSKCTPDPKYEDWENFTFTKLCAPPWLDQDASCPDAEFLDIATMWKGGQGGGWWTVTATACNDVIFSVEITDPDRDNERATRFLDEFRGKVCCQKYRDAKRTGQPCYPNEDFDCDGRSNRADDVIGDRPCP